jgi:cyclopropane-fatty-acyl-phospholipid synthase
MVDPAESTISLEDAALNRERLIAEKLKPQGKSVLDVGCGSGHFVNLVVRDYDARQAYGVTLSENQKSDADALFLTSGTGDRCRVDIKNYRDLEGQWDLINSVGMVSHLGVGMLDFYWSKIHSLLAPEGLYHHHSFMNYDKTTDLSDVAPLFSRKWVWPNYHWYRLDEHIRAAEQAGFEIVDIKCLRLHYARTIDHWYDRFLKREEINRKLVSESTLRAWRAYLANMAIGFRNHEFTVNQLLCKKLPKAVQPVVANLSQAKESRLSQPVT